MTVSMLGFGFVTIEVWQTQLPVWAFVLALTIGAFPNTPCGILPVNGCSPSHSAFAYTIPIGVITGYHKPSSRS
jgi:hypothetical protein